jgi:hypothetical protein
MLNNLCPSIAAAARNPSGLCQTGGNWKDSLRVVDTAGGNDIHKALLIAVLVLQKRAQQNQYFPLRTSIDATPEEIIPAQIDIPYNISYPFFGILLRGDLHLSVVNSEMFQKQLKYI